MFADDKSRERMRRKTKKRIDNESVKNQARKASLEAADDVWKSCIMILQDANDTGENSESHRGTSSSKALGFPGAISTMENWSDDDITITEQDKINHHNTTSNENIAPDMGQSFPAGGSTTNGHITTMAATVESAAVRGWSRGALEKNESSILPTTDMDDLDLPSITTGEDSFNVNSTSRSTEVDYVPNRTKSAGLSSSIQDQTWIQRSSKNRSLDRKSNKISVSSNILNEKSPPNNTIAGASSHEGTYLIANKKLSHRDQTLSQRVSVTARHRKWKNFFYGFNSWGGDWNSSKTFATSDSCDAWMCGVCGLAFASEASAERHELAHVEQLIRDLGYFSSAEYSDKYGSSMNVLTHSTMTKKRKNHANDLSYLPSPLSDSKNTKTPLQSNVLQKVTTPMQNNSRSEIFSGIPPPPLENDNENSAHSKRVMFDSGHERQSVNKTNPVLVNGQPKKSSLRKGSSEHSLLLLDADHGVETDFPESSAGNLSAEILVPRTRSRSLSVDGKGVPTTNTPIGTRRNSNKRNMSNGGFPGLEADIPDLPAEPIRTHFRSTIEHRSDDDSPIAHPLHLFQEQNDDFKSLFWDGIDDMSGVSRRQRITSDGLDNNSDVLLLSTAMRNSVLRPDEALVNVILRAKSLILTKPELHAMSELSHLAKDKQYYDDVSFRAAARQQNPSSRYRSDSENVLGKLQNKFLDAYQLMKESDGVSGGVVHDQYNRKRKRRKRGDGTTENDDDGVMMVHKSSTLYVNVMVRNSIRVVQHELQRLAKERWETHQQETKNSKFQRFRGIAQNNILKLAGIALASDFTPRRIAIQLSNDLYRLLTPHLKRRGVQIETEIEYRIGPYFVLAINIKSIEWKRLIKATHRDLVLQRQRWKKELEKEGNDNSRETESTKGRFTFVVQFFKRLRSMTTFDVLAQMFSILYYVHWMVYLPICWISYYTLLGASIRHLIINSVTDEIFYYIEEKGMEMEIKICRAEKQTAFMLSALREIRADDKELKKKQQESELQEKGKILGPYLGPAIKGDKLPSSKPDDFVPPPNLEFIGLDLDLPVGFRRLRWAFFSQKSQFMTEVFLKEERKHERISFGTWDKYPEHVGEPNLPDNIKMHDFIGAERENESLMPKSAFVSAIMSYEKETIIAYSEYCFCVKKRSRTPDAPFGNSFIAWTQIVVIDNGNDSCHMTCSVEPEFPNGPPMVANQIRSGMRAGVGEVFVALGSTIAKYADEFP